MFEVDWGDRRRRPREWHELNGFTAAAMVVVYFSNVVVSCLHLSCVLFGSKAIKQQPMQSQRSPTQASSRGCRALLELAMIEGTVRIPLQLTQILRSAETCPKVPRFPLYSTKSAGTLTEAEKALTEGHPSSRCGS